MRALAAFLASAGLAVSAALAAFAGDEWPTWSGDAGGLRYSPHAQIDKANVDRLEVAWVHHSGDVSDGKGAVRSESTYEATPILVDGTLYVCSPFNRVFALDPETGAERWVFDPKLDFEGRYGNDLVCRGVASWLDPERAEDVAGECRRRIFTATNDARLIALDAASGRPCSR